MLGEPGERVLAELRRENQRLAEQAEAAVEWLSAGQAFEPSQSGLQQFLWYELPQEWIVPPDEEAPLFAEVREGLAWVLARLGLERYAFICRSAITEVVNAAYLQSEQVGFRAFRRAMDGSGIEPPDLEDFSWGGLMGIEEASARDRVAGALEAAVASGELAVRGRGWRSHQRRLAAEQTISDFWALTARPIQETLERTGTPTSLRGYVELGLGTLSPAEIRLRDRYSKPARFLEELAHLASDGWVEAIGEVQYRVNARAHTNVQEAVRAGDAYLDTLDVLPRADLERHETLLERLVRAGAIAPEPPRSGRRGHALVSSERTRLCLAA